MKKDELVMDVGSVVDGDTAVREGLIDSLGGLSDAVECLYDMIENSDDENNSHKKSSQKKKTPKKQPQRTKARKTVISHDEERERAVSLFNMIRDGELTIEDIGFDNEWED